MLALGECYVYGLIDPRNEQLFYNRVKKVEYVFGVYNSLILAVYKPTEWFICETSIDKLPRKDIIITNENKNPQHLGK